MDSKKNSSEKKSSDNLADEEYKKEQWSKINAIYASMYDTNQKKWFIENMHDQSVREIISDNSKDTDDKSIIKEHWNLSDANRYWEETFGSSKQPKTRSKRQKKSIIDILMETFVKDMNRLFAPIFYFFFRNEITDAEKKSDSFSERLIFLGTFFALPDRQDDMTEYLESRYQKNLKRFTIGRSRWLLMKDVGFSILPILIAISRLRIVKFMTSIGLMKIMKYFLQ